MCFAMLCAVFNNITCWASISAPMRFNTDEYKQRLLKIVDEIVDENSNGNRHQRLPGLADHLREGMYWAYFYTNRDPLEVQRMTPPLPIITPEQRLATTMEFLTPERYAALETFCLNVLASEDSNFRVEAMHVLSRGLVSEKGRTLIEKAYAASVKKNTENAPASNILADSFTLAEALAYYHNTAGVEAFWQALEGEDWTLYHRAVLALKELESFTSDSRALAIITSENMVKVSFGLIGIKDEIENHFDVVILHLRRLREFFLANNSLDDNLFWEHLNFLGQLSECLRDISKFSEDKQKAIAEEIRLLAALPDERILLNMHYVFYEIADERDNAIINAMLRDTKIEDDVMCLLLDKKPHLIHAHKDALFNIINRGAFNKYHALSLLQRGMGEDVIVKALTEDELEMEIKRLFNLYTQTNIPGVLNILSPPCRPVFRAWLWWLALPVVAGVWFVVRLRKKK